MNKTYEVRSENATITFDERFGCPDPEGPQDDWAETARHLADLLAQDWVGNPGIPMRRSELLLRLGACKLIELLDDDRFLSHTKGQSNEMEDIAELVAGFDDWYKPYMPDGMKYVEGEQGIGFYPIKK